MTFEESEKIIVVEGLSDKLHVEKVLREKITVICTNGTLGIERFDELLYEYDLDNRDVYILVDEDRSGYQLRKLFKRELAHAEHLYIQREYREVAETPLHLLAELLVAKHIEINPLYLL